MKMQYVRGALLLALLTLVGYAVGCTVVEGIMETTVRITERVGSLFGGETQGMRDAAVKLSTAEEKLAAAIVLGTDAKAELQELRIALKVMQAEAEKHAAQKVADAIAAASSSGSAAPIAGTAGIIALAGTGATLLRTKKRLAEVDAQLATLRSTPS